MNLSRQITLLAVFALMLSACASPKGPPFELKPAREGKATIYAFRTASIVGGANSDIVSVNDRFIGRLNSGNYTVYMAEPGKLRVARKTGSIWGEGESGGWGLGGLVGAIDGFQEIVTFEGKANQIYFIRFPHGEMMPNEEALELMDRLENVTPAKK